MKLLHELLDVRQRPREFVDNGDRGRECRAGKGVQVDADHDLVHPHEGLCTVAVLERNEDHVRAVDPFFVDPGALRVQAGNSSVRSRTKHLTGPRLS